MALIRRNALETDRRTLALGAVAAGATIAVMASEVARVWRRGSAPMPPDAEHLLGATQVAVSETASVARAGYHDVSRRENALFNLLASFSAAFTLARWVTYLLRRRRSVGPFRSVRVGRRHIHHFVPGIVIAFSAGTLAILTRDEDLEAKLAVPFGVGMGLTLDESALLLELEDVYWTREGLLSVQITLTVIASLASLALGLRFLRRGERVVLESDDGPMATPGAG
jgi:hypothetical protein